MAKRGHKEEQILRALHQAEGGTRISDLCWEHGISEATYYVWKKKYAGLGLARCETRLLRGTGMCAMRLAEGSKP
jgi:putative transposase